MYTSFSGWDWLVLISAAFVFTGVLMAFTTRHKKFQYVPAPNDPAPLDQRQKDWEKKKAWWEDFWEVAVVLGLFLEVFSVFHTIHEAAGFKRDASEALKVAAKTQSNNLVLAKQVDEAKTKLAKAQANLIDLQNANLPMIDFSNSVAFALSLLNLPKVHITLQAVADANAQKTAMALAQAFFITGWEVARPLVTIPSIEEGIVIRCGKNPDTERSGRCLLELLTERGVPAKIQSLWLMDAQYPVPTNTLEVTVCTRPDGLHTKLMLIQGREAWLNEAMTNPELRRLTGLPNTNNIPNTRQAEEEYSRQTAQIRATVDFFQKQEQAISNQIENAKKDAIN